jgi:hypothetical protein
MVVLVIWQIPEFRYQKTKERERVVMCSQVKCRKCGKATWSGCGEHIEQALAGIPKNQRCEGHANEPAQPGFFAKIFGSNN